MTALFSLLSFSPTRHFWRRECRRHFYSLPHAFLSLHHHLHIVDVNHITLKMTAEMHKLANDPNFVVQFAIGEPLPILIAQSKDSGIRMCGVYFDTTKRYIMKHAHMSKEDVSTHHAFLSCFAIEEDSSLCIFVFFVSLSGTDIRRCQWHSCYGITPSRKKSI